MALQLLFLYFFDSIVYKYMYILTTKIGSISKDNKFWEAISWKVLIFCQTIHWVKFATKLAIILPKFSLSIVGMYCRNCISNEFRSMDSVLGLFSPLTFNCKNKFTTPPRVLHLSS